MYSTQQSSGGGGGTKALLIVGTASAAAVGGTVAYASVDKDFRLLVEDVVPGAGSLFEAALGKAEPEKTPVASKKPEIKVFEVLTNYIYRMSHLPGVDLDLGCSPRLVGRKCSSLLSR